MTLRNQGMHQSMGPVMAYVRRGRLIRPSGRDPQARSAGGPFRIVGTDGLRHIRRSADRPAYKLARAHSIAARRMSDASKTQP